MIFVYAEAM